LGIAERKEREKMRRRVEIINAAEKVFFNKGFDNTTMEDVAAKAELSKATLYLYFSKKTELCLAITVRSLKILTQMLEKIPQTQQSGIARFQAVADTFIEFYSRHLDYYNVLVNYRSHAGNCDAESTVLGDIFAENEKINVILAGIVVQGLEDRTIRPDIDPHKIAYALWGQLSGLMPNIMTSIGMTETVNRIEKYNPVEIFLYTFNLIRIGLENSNGAK